MNLITPEELIEMKAKYLAWSMFQKAEFPEFYREREFDPYYRLICTLEDLWARDTRTGNAS